MQPFSLAQCSANYKVNVGNIQVSSVSWTQIVGANPNRVALILSAENSNTWVSLTQGTVADTNTQIFLNPNQSVNVLTFEQCGPLLGLAWYGGIGAGVSRLGFIEVLYVPTGG